MPPKFYKSKPKSTPRCKIEEYTRPPDHKWLIIVESPSKCTKIEHLLGGQYKCIASKGHLRTIQGLRSIDTKNKYAIKFSIIESKTGHIESMRKIIRQFPETNILLGSDDDREGESIAWHICDIFGLDVENTKRIIFHEITKTALENAVNTPTKININIVNAQWARQVLDILIGYKISPMLWKSIHGHNSDSLSAGRCQTPALRLVYDNEMERRNGEGFQQKHKIIGKFSSKNLDFILNKEFENNEDTIKFLQKNIGFKHELTIGSPRISINSPPKPFNTSSLLQTCSNMLRLSPTDTMSICQELYQGGFITYMRTENRKYAGPFLNKIKEFISGIHGDHYIGNLDSIENKNSANPHEAIRVTNLNMRELNDNTGKKAAVYRIIWKNTIQSCMVDSKQELIDAIITAPENLVYKYTIEIPVFLGWRKEAKPEDTGSLADSQNKGAGLLLFLKSILESKQPIRFEQIRSSCVFQNRHSHYTESSLIKKLEEYGIGRPSTFAMFIETIQDRGYVLKQDISGESKKCIEYVLTQNGRILEEKKDILVGSEKGKLVIQPLGFIVIEFLIKYFDAMFSYDYTKNLEDKLDLVATQDESSNFASDSQSSSSASLNINWYSICEECNKDIKTYSKPVSDILKNKYPIDSNHSVVFTMRGPVICYNFTTDTKYLTQNTPDASDSQSSSSASCNNTNTDIELELENINKENKENKENQAESSFKSIKKDIVLDLGRLKSGGYTIQDLEEISEKTRLLGKWEEEDIYLKHGKFGFYLEWGSQKKACKIPKDKDPSEIKYEDIPQLLESKLMDNKNILRVLNSNISIRRGKFGAYIYYKTPSMEKPQFFSLKKFNHGFSTCEKETLLEWIQNTYMVC